MGFPVTLPGPAAAADAPATPILTRAQQVTFATRQVTPPSEVYVTTDDSLHVVIYCSQPNVTVLVAFRILRADGTVSRTPQVVTPSSNRARNDFFFNLTEGFLLSVDVSTATGSVFRGTCWVDIDISQGAGSAVKDYQSILSDYLTTGASIGFPGARQISSVEEEGAILSQQITTDPATAPVGFVVPAGARWRLLGFTAQLTTSAIAGNRDVSLILNGPAGSFYQFTCPNTQAPSLTTGYVAASVPLVLAAGVSPQLLPVPSDVILGATGAIEVAVLGAAAGDVWNNINISYEEWLEPVS